MFWITFLWQSQFLLARFQVIKIKSTRHMDHDLVKSSHSKDSFSYAECELLFSCSLGTGTGIVSLLLNRHNASPPTTGLFCSSNPYGAIHLFSLSSPFLVLFWVEIATIHAQNKLWIKFSSHSFLPINPATNLKSHFLIQKSSSKVS